MKLNEQQKAAIRAIESPNFKQFYGVFGAGGTGKTTAIKSIDTRFRVAFTAPTNKAVGVLRDSGCPPEDCYTIYKFLGLAVNEATGKVTIDKKGRCKSDCYDILVIDECSMLNTEICNRLKVMHRIKIVFMGDWAQLPPPKEQSSPVFKLIGDNHIVLTEQMRQRNALNPLLKMLSSVRDSVQTGERITDYSPFKGQILDDEAGLKVGVVIAPTARQWEQWLIKSFDDKRGFSTLAVAYRNDRVDQINAMVHNHFHPNSDIFCKGETLVFQRPVMRNKETIAENGELIEVVKVERMQEKVSIGEHRVMIDALKINDEFITPTDRNMFNNWIQSLMNVLNDPRQTAGYSWGEVYLLRDRFADLRHSYCVTVHKAQGSTVDNVFADCNDINRMPENQAIINRCLYTAFSRARFNAIILQ